MYTINATHEVVVPCKSWQAAQQLADRVLSFADFGQTVEILSRQEAGSDSPVYATVIISCPSDVEHLFKDIARNQVGQDLVGLEQLSSLPLEWESLKVQDQWMEQFNGSITIGRSEV
jgi:hypothetical protein